jgi:hypothetical protein
VAAADTEATWDALLRIVEGSFGSSHTGRIAGLLGCVDIDSSGPRPLATGSTLPGFHVELAEPADFPHLKGSVYRTLVIRTRGHVLITRRLLDATKRRAERI